MTEEEGKEPFLNVMKKLKPFTFKTELENADREILKEILAELQKANNALEQILDCCRNK
jgi:hypothetical protein